MRMVHRPTILLVLTLLLSIGIGVAYGASKYPDKPITYVVHSPPGDGSDITARFVAAAFEKYKFLPQPLVVENKPGGAAAVSMAYVAGKKKDPYTILGVTTLFLLTPLQGKSPIGYKDFTPICNLSFDEHMLMVSANSKFKSIKEVVDFAKANPEKVTVGGGYAGGAESINTYRFEEAAGIKVKYVGFGGGGDAVVALLGGHIDIASGNPNEVVELVKANKVRVLGVLTEKRLPFLPDIPTVKEQGVNAVGLGMYRGIVAPAGIPQEARKVLEEAFSKFSKTEEYKNFHRENMNAEGYMDSASFAKYLEKKNELCAAVLKGMGLIK